MISYIHSIGDISVRLTISSDPNTDQMEDFLSREQSVLVPILNHLKLKYVNHLRKMLFGDISLLIFIQTKCQSDSVQFSCFVYIPAGPSISIVVFFLKRRASAQPCSLQGQLSPTFDYLLICLFVFQLVSQFVCLFLDCFVCQIFSSLVSLFIFIFVCFLFSPTLNLSTPLLSSPIKVSSHSTPALFFQVKEYSAPLLLMLAQCQSFEGGGEDCTQSPSTMSRSPEFGSDTKGINCDLQRYTFRKPSLKKREVIL